MIGRLAARSIIRRPFFSASAAVSLGLGCAGLTIALYFGETMKQGIIAMAGSMGAGQSEAIVRSAESSGGETMAIAAAFFGVAAFCFSLVLAGTAFLLIARRGSDTDVKLFRLGASRGAIRTAGFMRATLLSAAGALLGGLIGYMGCFLASPLLERAWSSYGLEASPPSWRILVLACITTFVIGTCLGTAISSGSRGRAQDGQPKAPSRSGLSMPVILGITLFIASAILWGVSLSFPMLAPLGWSSCLPFVASVIILSPHVIRLFANVLSRKIASGGMDTLFLRSLEKRATIHGAGLSSVILCLAMGISILGLMHSLDLSLRNSLEETAWADILVFASGEQDLSHESVESARALSLVEDIEGYCYRFVPLDWPGLNDGGYLLQSLPVDASQNESEIEVGAVDIPAAWSALESNEAVFLHERLAKALGIAIGNGFDETFGIDSSRSLVVAAVVRDYRDFLHRMGKVAYVSEARMREMYPGSGYSILHVKLIRSADSQTVIAGLTRLPGFENTMIITREAERAEVSKGVWNILGVFRAFSFILFAILCSGMVATSLMSALARMRTIHLLRAAGLSRAKSIILIAMEIFFVSSVGSCLGGLAGYWLTSVLCSGAQEYLGLRLSPVFPGEAWLFLFLLPPALSVIGSIGPVLIARSSSLIDDLNRKEIA